jgi:hypothetical protein
MTIREFVIRRIDDSANEEHSVQVGDLFGLPVSVFDILNVVVRLDPMM